MDLGAVLKKWGMPTGPASSKRGDRSDGGAQRDASIPTAATAASSPSTEEGDEEATTTVIKDNNASAEIEARARRYVREKLQAAEKSEQVRAVADATTTHNYTINIIPLVCVKLSPR